MKTRTTLQPAVDREAFVRAPVGRYLAGSTWLYFYPTPSLSGFVLWGRLNEADLQLPSTITPEIHGTAARPHCVLIDARRVEQVDSAAFAVAAQYASRHGLALRKAIERAAIVYTPGLIGAVAEGFFRVVQPPYPFEVFSQMETALSWLGGEAALAAELDELQARVAGTPQQLRELRAVIDDTAGVCGLRDAAKRLGLSPRSLQRRLAAQQTSFQREIALARVAKAQALLIDSETSLTAIAFAVGCASLQHFSSVFRKITGATPSAWRSLHRRSRP